MEVVEINKALSPYKIVSRDEKSIMLHRRMDWKSPAFLIGLGLVILREYAFAQFLIPKFSIMLILVLYLFLFILVRWTSTSHPVDIAVHRDILNLRYRNFFGGIHEANIDSTTIKSVRPEVRSIGKGGCTAIVQLCLTNDTFEDLYFANRLYNATILVKYSELLAELFSSILAVPLIKESKNQSGLTRRSS